MHGKILYYNDTTGTGTIANQNRRVFEFTKSSWHDRRTLPEREMYVDFRLDERGHITDCRESSFRKLRRDYPIHEGDFWASEDDEKLEERAINLKESQVIQGMATLDLSQPLSASLPIDQCFERYFADELEMLGRYEELFANEDSYQFIDYAKLKPFLQKAKSHLLGIDPSIGHEPFLEIEHDINRAQQLLEGLDRTLALEAEVIFADMFLKHQIPYLQAQKRLVLEKERLLQLGNRLKKIPHDLEAFQRRLALANDSQTKESYQEKIDAILSEQKSIPQEIEGRKHNIKLLESRLEFFAKSHFEELMEGYDFKEQKEKIRFYLGRILDYLAFVLDYTIWQHASSSKNISTSFYNQRIQGGFNAFTFLRFYLKPLDKSRLNPQGRELYRYLREYDLRRVLKFLIVSEDAEFSAALKRQILASEKDALVFEAVRGVDAMPWVKSEAMHAIFVDMEMRSISIEEWLEFFYRHSPSPKAKAFCFVPGFGDAREEGLKERFPVALLRKGWLGEKLDEMFKRLMVMLKGDSSD